MGCLRFTVVRHELQTFAMKIELLSYKCKYQRINNTRSYLREWFDRVMIGEARGHTARDSLFPMTIPRISTNFCLREYGTGGDDW